MRWINIREPITGKLLFRYCPDHDLVEIKGTDRVLINLGEIKQRSQIIELPETFREVVYSYRNE
jgi:hypothetical protein